MTHSLLFRALVHISRQLWHIEGKLNKLLAKAGEDEELLQMQEQLEDSTGKLKKAVDENQPPGQQ